MTTATAQSLTGSAVLRDDGPRHTSTARAIAQFDRLTDRATVASVGVALHHFTELLAEPDALWLHPRRRCCRSRRVP